MKIVSGILAGALAIAALPVSAGTTQWLREGSQVINVTDDGGVLMCTRVSDGFEMCHGMLPQSPGIWTGPDMKHPDMPGFMTFNGTVTISGDQLQIKGCMFGGGMCDSEIWAKQ